MNKKISQGTVHKAPKDLQKIVMSSSGIQKIWEDITPLARNEWICWITSAKKQETRERRINIMQDKFKKGQRRSCCWAGCPHR
ncbi:YdeI/OmpD-associated family protein [Candidatus Nomurabacteria bacterium]|nr:YdeI/OmpD-associated family protein [Candidatus Nomurabacteria bacterium]